MTIRPEKLVVTSNYSPEQCFSNPEDIGPILRRFRVVTDLRDLPPIPDQVPLELLQPLDGQLEAPGPEQVPLEVRQEGREGGRGGEGSQLPAPEEGTQVLAPWEGRQGQLLPAEEEAHHNMKRSLEQGVTREQVIRVAEGDDEQQEDYMSGQPDQRCLQQ